ncbi:NACHT domain-containing protein [Pedobacter aquatilis]|uniref:NACHT domain-containing protein n=1 Tax=Pedobacter aquatilis TaxID=351343 RepID=UPI0029303799|nr:NACHT domain-containing protein [Pedobacter aquatilis]
MDSTNSTEKINSLKTLSKEKLFNLIKAIVQKLGYSDIEEHHDVLTANYSGPLSNHRHAFIYLDEKLNASEHTKAYQATIENFSALTKIVTFFIFSNNIITKGFQNDIKNLLPNFTIDFLGRDDLIKLIEAYLLDFWKHDDVQLLNYEKTYCDSIYGDNDLKKLQIFNEKYDRLLQIFIEPTYHHFYEDKSTNTPVRKKVSMDQLVLNKNPILLSGNAGTGKTTSLKKIGELLINANKTNSEKKNLPVFLSITEIFESNYELIKLIYAKLSSYFTPEVDLFEEYNVIILIDTIDELEDENQSKILTQLEELHNKKGANYIIASRNHEKLYANPILKTADNFSIEKFNNDQIKRFISNFFLNETSRADRLLDALKDNRILEKLPITPLTLSLISILYEENNLEIPATITDIYDNFNSVLLGKATVASRVEFIDSSFRERILSLYGLALLEAKEHTPMSKAEFYKFFENYYKDKTIPIRKGNLEDALEHLIGNTGILFLKDGKYVQFSHDSFMEYYGALEIFKHQRDKEILFIENFYDINWQNSSFFYGGKSKDMSNFLRNVVDKVKKASKINDFFMGVMGLGYLMQSLYQTDNKLRKDGVDTAVNLNIQAHEALMKITGDDVAIFKNYKLPILLLMNVFYFYENFNSITLREPLSLLFEEYFKQYEVSKDTNDGYKSLKLALTLNSKRINETKALESLIFNSNITHDPSLILLTDLALEMEKTENYKELKKVLRRDYHKFSGPVKKLTEIPASRLRFSSYDTIRADRKVIFITEGKTDAKILEHAFIVLTEGNIPYWEIKPAGDESGGANELAKLLQNSSPVLGKEQKYIGLFDRDAKGLQEFNGLKNFEFFENHTVKKHVNYEIYAICLPAIGDREQYIQEKQVFNFLEIEHYFSDELLDKHKKLKKTSLPGIFEIQGNKTSFANEVLKLSEPRYFTNFIELFERVDKITDMEIIYSS